MKKLILFLNIIFGICLFTYSQPTVSLSTLLTWYETGDKPTEEQFATAWTNSYNQVADGLWDMTGGPTISFAPYSSTGLNRFYTGSSLPQDTTYKLNYNGVLRVSKLVVNAKTIDFSSIEEFWTNEYDATVVALSDTSMDVSVGSGSSYGYNFYVKGESYFKDELKAIGVTVTNETGLEGNLWTDENGDLYLQDENSGPFKLSTLYSSGPWTATTHKVYNTSYTTDTVVIGAIIGGKGRFFNVKKSAYFGDSVYFDGIMRTDANFYSTGGIYANSGLVSSLQYNISYAGQTGYITLYGKGNPGKITFTDEDFPSGVTLSELSSTAGYFKLSTPHLYPTSSSYNLALGSTNAYGYKLYVNGNVLSTGNGTFLTGVSIASGTKFYTGINSYIQESGMNMIFRDASNTTAVTLTELLGGGTDERDTLHVHRLCQDTSYFSNTTMKMYSPYANNIILDINGSWWNFEYENNAYGVFNASALKLTTLMDTLQEDPIFKELGKIYLSKQDSNIYYYNGKAWLALADSANVIYQVENNTFDIIDMDTLSIKDKEYYLTEYSTNQFEIGSDNFNSIYFGPCTPLTSYYAQARTLFLNYMDASYDGGPGGIMSVFTNDTALHQWEDTTTALSYAAIMDLIDYYGGGGGGTPGGSSGDIQYNNAGSFGGFWGFDTDTIEANNTSAIKFGTLNRLRSISTSMIIGAQGTSYYFTANNINTSTNYGPQINKAAGSTTSPVYTFYNDNDVGFSRSSTNQMSFISNSIEIMRMKSDTTIFYKPVKLKSSGLTIDRNYNLQFTDAATNYWRIYQADDNELRWNYNGTDYYSMNNSVGLARETNYGFMLDYNVATSTNPVYTFYGDDNTGMGNAGGDKLSLISGGNEIIRLTTDSIIGYKPVRITKLQFNPNVTQFNYGNSMQINATSTAYVMSQGYFLSNPASNDGFYIKTTGYSSTIPLYSFYKDQNTGIGSDGQDTLNVIVGGENVMMLTPDSIIANDSLYFKYISGTEATFMTLTPTRAGDSASIKGAMKGIKYRSYIPDFIHYYNDTARHERLWYFDFDEKRYEWSTKRGLKLNNVNSLTALQYKSEFQDEWMYQLFNQDDALLDRIKFLEDENSSQRNVIRDLEKQIKFLDQEIEMIKKLMNKSTDLSIY